MKRTLPTESKQDPSAHDPLMPNPTMMKDATAPESEVKPIRTDIKVLEQHEIDARIMLALREMDDRGLLRQLGSVLGRTEPELRAMANASRVITDYDRLILMDQLDLGLMPTGE